MDKILRLTEHFLNEVAMYFLFSLELALQANHKNDKNKHAFLTKKYIQHKINTQKT